jgi:two-component system response regulator HydG
LKYDWPGNVRELRNSIRGAMVKLNGPLLGKEHLPQKIVETTETQPSALTLSLNDVEREHILTVMRLTDKHLGKAAQVLRITPKTLRNKLKKYGF